MNERIKKLRKALDLTQQAFADRIGLKRNTIAQYEIGRNEPIDAVILSICREFEVNKEWIETGNGEMFIQKSENEKIAEFLADVLKAGEDDQMYRFIAAISELDENDWNAIRKMAEMFVKK